MKSHIATPWMTRQFTALDTHGPITDTMLLRALLLPFVLVSLLAGCQPAVENAQDNPLAGYESPEPLVLRAPEAPMPVPGVVLDGVDGPVDASALFAGRWTLLYVGYSYCPDICPTELGQLSRILPALQENSPQFDWQVVFLSVDSERDTPAHLEKYTAFFSEEFVPVTGSREAIDAVTGAVKAGYRIGEHAPGERRYSVDHDTGFRLIDPQGRMLALLPGPHHPDQVVTMIQSFLAEVRPE
ncbi:SCO family protein [Guyparkeria sp. GHLCS8-2]|uniref:SCO family protein n=1 Tax=Guyparkeria halopsychrophila TaxID=3139421 RepID=UPI0037C5ED4B